MGLLKLEEVAARLGIGNGAARILVLEGTIPMVKVGPRGIRVEEEELERYIATKKEEQDV